MTPLKYPTNAFGWLPRRFWTRRRRLTVLLLVLLILGVRGYVEVTDRNAKDNMAPVAEGGTKWN